MSGSQPRNIRHNQRMLVETGQKGPSSAEDRQDTLHKHENAETRADSSHTCPCGYFCTSNRELVTHILISHLKQSETEGLQPENLHMRFKDMEYEQQKRFDFHRMVPYTSEQPKPIEREEIEFILRSSGKAHNIYELLEHLIFNENMLSTRSLEQKVLESRVIKKSAIDPSRMPSVPALSMLSDPITLETLPPGLEDMTTQQASTLLTEMNNYISHCMNEDLICLDQMAKLEVGDLLPYEAVGDNTNLKNHDLSTADNSSGKKKPSMMLAINNNQAKFASPSNQIHPKEVKGHPIEAFTSKVRQSGLDSPRKDSKHQSKHHSSKHHGHSGRHHSDHDHAKTLKKSSQAVPVLPSSQDTKSTNDTFNLGKRSPLPLLPAPGSLSSPKNPVKDNQLPVATPQKHSSHSKQLPTAESLTNLPPAERTINKAPSYKSSQASPAKNRPLVMTITVSKDVAKKLSPAIKLEGASVAQSQTGRSGVPSDAKSLPTSEYSRTKSLTTGGLPPAPDIKREQAADNQPETSNPPVQLKDSRPPQSNRPFPMTSKLSQEFKPIEPRRNMFNEDNMDKLRNLSETAHVVRNLGAGPSKRAPSTNSTSNDKLG